jgi:cysteinyl-tRNA synthetase
VTLTLYNTLTRRKEPFRPLEPEHVRVYVCGPTVYDRIHIGNARPLIVFDVLVRLLRHLYPRVTYVRNITDIDDKIIDAAKRGGEPIEALTERTTRAFHEDAAWLGCLPPDVEPKATEHVPEMIALIERLLASNHAYEAEGHVLFHVPSMPDYGRLSRRDRSQQIEGARVEVAPYKRDPADFVLWKPSTADQPGWDSPWGRGRPGWHIECSAMSERYLGLPFDIHGGGIDLVFPHHENEIAQSCCAHGLETMARVWMHNGFVTVGGEKMAKSAGNFTTVEDALSRAHGEVLRLWTLGTHYRHPLDFSEEGLKSAKASLDRLYLALRGLEDVEAEAGEAPAEVTAALSDDLNTPEALAALHDLATQANKSRRPAERAQLKTELLQSGKILGLLQHEPGPFLQGLVGQARFATATTHGAPTVPQVHALQADNITTGRPTLGTPTLMEVQEIERLIAERTTARKGKDFARADAIRDELAAEGIILEDGPSGTTWRRA